MSTVAGDSEGQPPEDDPLGPTYTPSYPIVPRGSGSGGRVDPSSPQLHRGRTLSERWEVGDRIGMGGMASVHRGVDLRLGRAVAIKILHPHVSDSPEARTRLAREARAIAQLKHENVIEVYDYSIDDPGCVWLVTELISGSTLRAVVDAHKKTLPEIAALVVGEVVRALRAAHEVGVVHRDVKPDNVLVGKEGRPKLSDFGIAQIVDEQRMTMTGNLVGSPTYMSPEQAEGRRMDHRTDLFSAGIMLYRMVTGVLPFHGNNAIETLRKVASAVYVDAVEIEPSIPGSVAAVIRRALSPNIEDRYQSAAEMLADLQAIARDAGLGAPIDELKTFFEDPDRYEAEVAPKIARSLFARGNARLARGEEAEALDDFTRARALGISDDTSVDLVKVLSARRIESSRSKRNLWIAGVGGALGLVVAFGAVMATGGGPEQSREIAVRETPTPVPTPIASPAASPIAQPSATPVPVSAAPTLVAAPIATPSPSPSRSATPSRRPRPEPTPTPIASATPTPTAAAVIPDRGELLIGTKYWADIYVNEVKLGQAPGQNKFRLPAGTHHLRALNTECPPAVEQDVVIVSGETTKVRLTIPCP